MSLSSVAASLLASALAAPAALAQTAVPAKPDRAGERWVERTLKKMTRDERIGQVLVPGLSGSYTPVDSEPFEKLVKLTREGRVGGFHVFGGSEAVPAVLLNPNYGRSGGAARKADPLGAAALLNRLQLEAAVPLLFTADFEGGAGYIVENATRISRAMAIGATGDRTLAERAGEVAAREGRSLGIHVNFFPVLDVNNNPRNPIINMRSFGEDPAFVGEMGRALIEGLHKGGMLATAKHFPGHGDTAVDTHLDLAVIEHPRERLEQIELVPFRAAIAGGVDAVMSAHVRMPAFDPAEGVPATLSRPILTGLLRDELRFDGLIITDAMEMHAISRRFPPDQAAAMAVKAGADLVLVPPDPEAALRGIREAVEKGEIPMEQVDRSVRRILRAKARLGLHKARGVDLMAVGSVLGGRANQAVADEVASRAITLLKDERGTLPLKLEPGARVLYLSVIDYTTGWREGAPSRAFVPELKRRFPALTAIEVSDRTTAAELDLVRELARGADAVVVGAFVRIASYSGRMDLSPAQLRLLEDLGRGASKPFVVALLGNPYAATIAPKLPAVLLTYETSDVAERAAVRAILGEAPIRGKLPIGLPELYPVGHGLERQ
jgi:beta-N-acetylhexosaminidase